MVYDVITFSRSDIHAISPVYEKCVKDANGYGFADGPCQGHLENSTQGPGRPEPGAIWKPDPRQGLLPAAGHGRCTTFKFKWIWSLGIFLATALISFFISHSFQWHCRHHVIPTSCLNLVLGPARSQVWNWKVQVGTLPWQYVDTVYYVVQF